MARKDKPSFGSPNGLTFNNVSKATSITDSEFCYIPKEKIHYSPFNEGMDMDRVNEYAESMKETGLIEPIVVYALSDGDFEILTGHQRFEAWCNILGHPTIKAIVRPYEKDVIKRFTAHTEANTLNRNLDLRFWLSRIKTAKKILKENGFNGSRKEEIEKISEMLNGVSKSQIYRYESFEKLVPELQIFETRHWLSAMTLYAAVGLDEEQQKQVAETVMNLYSTWLATKDETTPDFEITRNDFNAIVSAVKNKEDTAPKTKSVQSFKAKLGSVEKNIAKTLHSVKTAEDVSDALGFITAMRNYLDEAEEQLNKYSW